VARLLRGELSTQDQERWQDAYGACSYQYELDNGMLVKIAQLEQRIDGEPARLDAPKTTSCNVQERSQDPIGDASPAALMRATEGVASCVQWGMQLDTESEDEVDLRCLRPPNNMHAAESIVPHGGPECHHVQSPTLNRVRHNSGQFILSRGRGWHLRYKCVEAHGSMRTSWKWASVALGS
jgi:hypothetical protein